MRKVDNKDGWHLTFENAYNIQHVLKEAKEQGFAIRFRKVTERQF